MQTIEGPATRLLLKHMESTLRFRTALLCVPAHAGKQLVQAHRRQRRLLLVLMLALVFTGLLVKTLASSLFFSPDNALTWITPGAQGGFLIGLIMLAGLAFAPQVAQRRLAVVTLVLALIVVNTIPANPYFVATLQAWQQGKFLNFNGAAQFMGMAWPFFALWFLLLPSHRLNRQ